MEQPRQVIKRPRPIEPNEPNGEPQPKRPKISYRDEAIY
jgi:hypothetical protein